MSRQLKILTLSLFLLLAVSVGCTQTPASNSASVIDRYVFITVTPAPLSPAAATASANIDERPLTPIAACTGTFKEHTLDHTTSIAGDVVRMFDSNGSGLAVNDLDNDSDLDLVLANLKGDNAIFWNDGNLSFRKETLPYGDARAANIIDVDSDGWQDIVFTQRSGSPLYWHNDGGRFSQTALPGVMHYAYAMAWGDLDQDGDLDLVTGSYDAELSKALGNVFLFSGGAGVFYYENLGGAFTPTRLADEAQTLAIFLTDLNDDFRPEILVGNDFGMPDFVWQRQPTGWQPVHPFAETTHSTMSFEAGDTNNDGQLELFATDMKPYATDPQTLSAWAPVMADMSPPPAGDPQIMENVLQVATNSRYENRAAVSGLAATGWSWSGKFGDLDNDGFLDVYVVNGMMAEELFGELPNAELVEQNQAFRNDGTGQFVPAPEWALAATDSGRGMSMADLDNDGDLDIIVNNLLAPARIFENQLCSGSALEVDLFWPASQNDRGLGAQAILHTSTGTYRREVRSGSGYLSGDPARLHFGLPTDTAVEYLEIRWPDGAMSKIDNLAAGSMVTVNRN
ncbi:MAG: CRTAC1 family protein [Anaerolineaceae bacterium]|nr:CRTAC1 family protein [Anaerolineaceae bacterium]